MTESTPVFAAPEGEPPVTPLPAPTGLSPQPPSQPAFAAPVTPVVKPAKKGGGMTNLLFGVAIVVAAAGIAFAIGRTTAPAQASNGAAAGFGGQPGAVPGGSFDPANGGFAGGPGGDRTMTLTGTVTAVDGTTMTMTTAGGQTVTVDTTGTTYHAQAPATATDVTTGTSVQVSVTGMGGVGRPGAAASAAPDPSAAPAAGTGTATATDITIVSK